MYASVKPFSYYSDLDMALFATDMFRRTHYFLVPRPLLQTGIFEPEKLIKWEIASSSPRFKQSECDLMDQNILGSGDDDPDLTKRIDCLIHANRQKDAQKNSLYAAEISSLYHVRIYPAKARDMAHKIAVSEEVSCPELKWKESKAGQSLDRFFLMRAALKRNFLTPRLVESGMVMPSPLIGALIVDFFQAATFWERETTIKRAFYHTVDRDITFEADHALEHFVVHEMAHYIVDQKSNIIQPAHGVEFVRKYQEMLRRYIPQGDQEGVLNFIEACRAKDLTGMKFIEQFPDMKLRGPTLPRHAMPKMAEITEKPSLNPA